MQDTNRATESSERADASGKYLAFPLSTEKYGLRILRVQEIIGVGTITKVPRSKDYIKGVVNLRGKIIPVIDLRLKFGLPAAEYDEKTCVVVVDLEQAGQRLPVGIIVDTVQEVMHFDSSQIEPAPNYGARLDNQFIIGLGRSEDDDVVVLLDIDKVFLGESLSMGGTTSEG